MNVIRISNTMVEIPLSEDMVRALRLIVRMDFSSVQCVDSRTAGSIASKLDLFCAMRRPDEIVKFMEFYRLYDLADGKQLRTLVKALNAACEANVGAAMNVEVEADWDGEA